MIKYRTAYKTIYQMLVSVFSDSRQSRAVYAPSKNREALIKSHPKEIASFDIHDNWLPTYEAQGFCIVDGVWSTEQIDKIKKLALGLERISQQVGQKKGLGRHQEGDTQFILQANNGTLSTARIVWVGGKEPYLLEMGRSQPLLSALAQILGTTEANHLINQLHFKLPKDNVHFPWHQDIQNRYNRDPRFDTNRANNGSFVQVITALERHMANSGPIQLIPGSHKFGALVKDSPAFLQIIEQATAKKNIQPIFLEKGQSILCHPFTLHCSEPNNSSHSRLTFINGYCAVGSNNGHYPGCGTGETVRLQP